MSGGWTTRPRDHAFFTRCRELPGRAVLRAMKTRAAVGFDANKPLVIETCRSHEGVSIRSVVEF